MFMHGLRWGLFFSSFLWLFILQAVAEGKQGLDVLGLAKIDVRVLVQEIDYDTAIGFLDNTFGDPYPKLRVLLDSGKVSAYRGHLRDFTCYRNKVCPAGTPDQHNTKIIRREAREFAAFAKGYPGIDCYVGPALEHDVKDKKTVDAWFRILREEVPQCKPVCSAFTGYCPPNVLREKHGNTGTADIRSNDGASLFDSNSADFRTSGKYLSLGWINEFNGRVTGEEPPIPMPKTRVNFAGRDLIRQAVRVMRAPQPRPEVACPVIKAPDLFKTNAEAYGKGKDDGRGNKGLWIHAKKYPKVQIETLAGRTVGCLAYYGTFSGGGFRHYVGSCSRQNPTDLMDALGSEWGILRAGGRCWLFNSIRRLGSFR